MPNLLVVLTFTILSEKELLSPLQYFARDFLNVVHTTTTKIVTEEHIATTFATPNSVPALINGAMKFQTSLPLPQ